MHQAKWIVNVMPVPKKDGKVKMCMDFKDLNKAFPKDDFPLPHIDVLVDSTTDSVGNMHIRSGKLNGSTSFSIYNMHYVNLRIQV